MDAVRSWREVFTKQLADSGFKEAEIGSIYRAEMGSRTEFDFEGLMPGCLRLQNIERYVDKVVYYWSSESRESECPHCNTMSVKPACDYYEAYIQDVPQFGKAVFHAIRLKRYICLNEKCAHKRFVERFYELSGENSAKTNRFKEYCIKRAVGSGCHRAEREIKAEGGIVSDDTINRYTVAKVAGAIADNLSQDNVRVVGIDDINGRKGDSSTGRTVFIDEETHKALLIIVGKTKEATKKVLELFPSIKHMSRDRATGYASAGEELGFIQSADRFHLFENAHKAVKDALAATLPVNLFVRDGDGWIQVSMEDGSVRKAYYTVPEEMIEPSIQLAGLTDRQAEKYRNTIKMIELSDKGLMTADIATALGIPYNDVTALRRTAAKTLADVEDKIKDRIAKCEAMENATEIPGEKGAKTVSGPRCQPAARSIVEPYRETVVDLWKAGGNSRTIYPVLQSQGYAGSKNAIYQYLLKLGKESPDEVVRAQKPKDAQQLEGFDLEQAKNRPALTLEKIPRDSVYKAVLKEAKALRKSPDVNDQSAENADTTAAPQNAAETAEGCKPPKNPRPASAKTSPLSDTILDLIFGPKEQEGHQEQETQKQGSVKKNRSLN